MKKKKIEFASDERLGYLKPWVKQVMEVVCRLSGVEDYLFISDLSSISDFPIEEKHLPELCKELGVQVKEEDLIADVAQRIKNKFG